MKKHTYENVARLIKDARINAGLTQGDLAKVMGYESPQAVSNTERAMASIPLLQFKAVARALKIKPTSLVEAYMLDVRESVRKSIGV